MLRTSMSTLSKTLTASALTLTIAFTGITASTSPASANGHRNNHGGDAAAVFGGLLLLYGLSQAGRNGNIQVDRGGHRPIGQHPRPRQNHRVAPERCFTQGHDNHGRYRGYRARCMQNHASRPNLLPSNCLRQVWTDRGHRNIYGARCLQNNGWVRG